MVEDPANRTVGVKIPLLKRQENDLCLTMTGKSIFFVTFIAAIAVVLASNSNPAVEKSYAVARANISHNLVVGSRLPGDRLVLKASVIKASAWLQIVTVQQTYNISKYERITQVRALDQKVNGNGATASLLNGGPGVNNVTLRFKSQRGHGINFIVELYAKP